MVVIMERRICRCGSVRRIGRDGEKMLHWCCSHLTHFRPMFHFIPHEDRSNIGQKWFRKDWFAALKCLLEFNLKRLEFTAAFSNSVVITDNLFFWRLEKRLLSYSFLKTNWKVLSGMDI